MVPRPERRLQSPGQRNSSSLSPISNVAGIRFCTRGSSEIGIRFRSIVRESRRSPAAYDFGRVELGLELRCASAARRTDLTPFRADDYSISTLTSRVLATRVCRSAGARRRAKEVGSGPSRRSNHRPGRGRHAVARGPSIPINHARRPATAAIKRRNARWQLPPFPPRSFARSAIAS